MNKKKFYWLDDWREAPADTDDTKVYWAKNSEEFEKLLETEGLPDEVSFDYQLGPTDRDGDGGFWCAKSMLRLARKIKAPFPKWHVHSEHPNKDEIIKMLQHYENMWEY